MITIYFKNDAKVQKNVNPDEIMRLNPTDIFWIDLDSPNNKEKEAVEKLISMKLLTQEQAEEIESTSKYSETPDAIIANCNFFISQGQNYHIEPTSFIITKDGFLVSDHKIHPASFQDIDNRIKSNPKDNEDGKHVFLTILEALIDYDADMFELIARQISTLAKDINSSDDIEKGVLRRINHLQEKTMSMRENIFDLQRLLSAIVRSSRFPSSLDSRLNLMLKDVDSLINHGDICSERLDYMQDNVMGLINIEQNEIVKILSVAAVIFMPPTLIASIYGMNFKVMPELNWVLTMNNGWIIPAGYIFAIIMMILVSFITYWFFKYKKWL